MDLYFFDLDRTLYAYNFHYRLPALARLSGASQYQIASSWWAGGHEIRAEAGEWASARALSMSRVDASVEALRRAAELGTVCLLSNNPSPLGEALPLLAPEAVEIVGDNILVSYMLGARKPEPELFTRALDRFGASASTTFFSDDSAENIAGARSVGITGYHLEYMDGVPQTDTLLPTIEAFAGRDR